MDVIEEEKFLVEKNSLEQILKKRVIRNNSKGFQKVIQMKGKEASSKRSRKLVLGLSLIIVLVLLLNFGTVSTNGSVSLRSFFIYNSFTIIVGLVIFMSAILGYFLFDTFRPLLREYKQKNTSRLQKVQRRASICSILAVFFSVLIGILVLVFNYVLLGTVLFTGIFIAIVITIPNSLRNPYQEKDSSKPWINEKERRKRINLSHSFLKAKEFLKRDRKLKQKGISFIPILLISTLIGFFANSFLSNNLIEPEVALVPQEFRKNGIEYDRETLEYLETIDELEEITFNSMIILKFTTSLSGFKTLTYHAELIPFNVSVIGPLEEEAKMLKKRYTFLSKTYRGPYLEKDIYFGIDLDACSTPVLPGSYKLNIYSIVHEGLFQPEVSNTFTYDVIIEKDYLSFNPNYQYPSSADYFDDPLRSTRRDNIYSIYDKERLRWANHFNTRVEDSMGKGVSGIFSLYLTQRQGAAKVYKKVTDYTTDETGLIQYTNYSKNHYREYMRGKIEFDGSQSLWYHDTVHYEDCEVAEGKILHTSSYPDNPMYRTNGTDFQLFNKNEFRVTNHLYYYHEFSSSEIKWTDNPNYEPNPGPPDIIYLDVSEDMTTYIESPLLGYLGTTAQTGVFKYRYEFYNFGTPVDDIWVDLKMQLYRDGELVYEETTYQGYYKIRRRCGFPSCSPDGRHSRRKTCDCSLLFGRVSRRSRRFCDRIRGWISYLLAHQLH